MMDLRPVWLIGSVLLVYGECVLGDEGRCRAAAYLKVPLAISGLNGRYILKSVMVLRP